MASKIKISELPALTGTVADSYNIPIDDGSTTYKVSVAHFEEAAAHTASEYAAAAAVSAEAAAGSAGEAATTATTIETDIGTATRLVNDARGYASSAADSVTAAQAASGAATTKANEASNSANAAAGSAGEAAASATTASNYVTNAQAEANRAKSWADYPNATGSSGDATHNAHYWADVAQAIAGGGVTSFNGRGGVVVPEAGDYSAGMISYDNASSGLAATDAQAAIDEVNTDLNTLDTAVETLDTNKANASQLAAVEDGETSSAAYTAGDYISRNGVLYEVIAAVTIGDSFTVGTNIQATTVGDEVEAIKTDLSDYHVVPSKNLCPFHSQTVSGIPFVADNDGYLTCSIEDTRLWSYSLANEQITLKAGTYKVRIFEKTAKTSGYIGFTIHASDDTVIVGNNPKPSFETLLAQDVSFTLAADTAVGIEVKVGNGAYAVEIVKSDDNTIPYVPYWECMRDGMFPRAEQRVLGAKNLLKIDANTQTINGVTFTVNRDSNGNVLNVTANGTATAVTVLVMSTYTYVQGEYILSGCPSGGNSGTSYAQQIRDTNNNTIINDEGNGKSGTLSGGVSYRAVIRIGNGYTANNLVFYPMLRLASDPDDTYAPYAMSNGELTENVLGKMLTSATLNNVTTPGRYILNGVSANGAGFNYGTLDVYVTTMGIVQVMYGVSRPDKMYKRNYYQSTWTAWYEFSGSTVS